MGSYGSFGIREYLGQINSVLPSIPIEKIREGISNIHKNLDNGITSKEMSLNKWEKIKKALEEILTGSKTFVHLEGLKDSFGYHTCAFCVESTDKYRLKHGEVKVNIDRCTECPLAKIDCCPLEGSIFNKFLKDYSNIDTYNYNSENMQKIKNAVADVELMIKNIQLT